MLIPLNSIVQYSMKSQLWPFSSTSPPLSLAKTLTFMLARDCSFGVPTTSDKLVGS